MTISTPRRGRRDLSEIDLALFGAGQIGSIHARGIVANPKARLKYVIDTRTEAAQRIAAATGAAIVDCAAALADPAIKGVVIASATDTHADLAIAAAAAGKAIFCEKPIHLALDRVDACLAAVKRAGVPFQIGFNRRFDASFRAVRDGIDAGRVGKVELVVITSRDPAPDNEDYLRVSGGLFRDMTIHDFDMARFLLGEEPIEVFAAGQIMPDFGCFDAASKGTIEAFMASPQYWKDKEPAIEWFATIPFGMNPEGMAAWYHQGDGLKLWEEAYANFGLVPRPGPSTTSSSCRSGRRRPPQRSVPDRRRPRAAMAFSQ